MIALEKIETLKTISEQVVSIRLETLD